MMTSHSFRHALIILIVTCVDVSKGFSVHIVHNRAVFSNFHIEWTLLEKQNLIQNDSKMRAETQLHKIYHSDVAF